MDPIKQLIDGFAAFTRRSYRAGNPYLRLVKQGQSPRIALVACSDSRVDPSLTLDCDPGDLFVIRNVGALVPPCEPDGAYHGTSAALEFAVCALKVEHIVVMGHALCGGMQALVQGDTGTADGGGFIQRWVSLAEPALARAHELHSSGVEEDLASCCEREAVKLSLDNLLTFSWVRESLADGSLELHGWYFDLPAGQLLGYDQEAEGFVRLA
jgi:carbonic anhydrase